MGRGGAGGQRHQRERAAGGVELSRKAAMGQAMGQKHGQRALPVGVNAGLEPGGAARFRIPPVGANDEPGRDRASVFQPRPGGARGEVVGGDAVRDPLEAGNAAGLVGEGFGHPVVLDIPAERIEPDFGGVELDRAGRKERSRVVDETQRAQRRGLGPQPRPKAERVEKSDRGVEKGDGAAAPGSLARAAHDDVEAGPGKSEGGREPGQPRAGDQDVRGARGRRFVVGHRRSPASLPESPDARPNDRGDGAAQL